MGAHPLSRVPDPILRRDLLAHVAQESQATAVVLAYIAEFDARRLFRSDGYTSMYHYCLGRLRLSEDAAYKRIQVARAARRFSAILPAMADGRLHLAAVGLLAPHLTEQNSDDLLGAAAGKTKHQVEEVLARMFPRSEMLPMVERIPTTAGTGPAPGQAGGPGPEQPALAATPVPPPAPGPRIEPIAAQRFAMHFSIGLATHDKFRRVQALLSHQVPSGDIAQVFDRTLDVALLQLERRKCGATSRPRPSGKLSANPRYVPAEVRRAVWARDEGRCTFVSVDGHRCEARSHLEFDHIVPVARGGASTAENVRIRCRTHNQYAAERAFGSEYIGRKRQRTPARSAPADPTSPGAG